MGKVVMLSTDMMVYIMKELNILIRKDMNKVKCDFTISSKHFKQTRKSCFSVILSMHVLYSIMYKDVL
jgi:hypothetical protein